ncbi:MAG: hypothetical protein UZ14_CFX002002470 [Chloroflexi bacterium OLB14]|nr:MAG: hypothetical protein UZ14_CFX002002470 [Chloroflexi bacterium OLB14]
MMSLESFLGIDMSLRGRSCSLSEAISKLCWRLFRADKHHPYHDNSIISDRESELR